MKFIKRNLLLLSILAIVLVSSACGNKSNSSADLVEPTADEDGNIDIKVNISGSQFHGTMSKNWKKEEPTKKEQRNIEEVQSILNSTNLEVNSDLFDCVYGELDGPISVWALQNSKDGDNLNYYGVIIRSNGNNYDFADVCHGKNPVVDYDEKAKILYIAGDVIEGTGTHVDALYVFSVKDNGDVVSSNFIDPFTVQEYIRNQMTYDVNQNIITLKVKNRKVAEIENTEDGEGALRAISIGEQIMYEFDEDHKIKVYVMPGIKFGVGTSLYYDNMPTITADVKVNKDKVDISNIKVSEE